MPAYSDKHDQDLLERADALRKYGNGEPLSEEEMNRVFEHPSEVLREYKRARTEILLERRKQNASR